MVIDIARLGTDERAFTGEEPASILELDGEETMRAEGPVRYELTAVLVNGNLVVRGTVKADISVLCVRCAEFYSTTVKESEFLRAIEVDRSTESVNLTEDIRESIILAFPTQPLCSSDCGGLCARCGANLNKDKCRCEELSKPGIWGALDELTLN